MNLETQYMGLTLKNPIVIGSSGLTNSTDKIQQLEEKGAAAVVLKSIFEEQILNEADSMQTDYLSHSEEMDYLIQYSREHSINEYLKLIEESKKRVDIPIIASINCVSSKGWTSFSKKIQNSGADGLELNIFIIPGNNKQKGEEVEKIYFDIINAVKSEINIPLAIKVCFYFSGLANMLFNLSVRDISALVLFNRFFSPDIDLDSEEVISSNIFSYSHDLSLPLRWIGMVSDEVKCDLAASTGVHDGDSLIKCLLVGAKAVQVVSAIYKNGPEYIQTMLDQMQKWMTQHRYTKVADFIGKLSQDSIKDPLLYERSQFMKYYSKAKL